MVCDRENLSSVLDSAPQKSINLAKIFKKFSTTVKMQACIISCFSVIFQLLELCLLIFFVCLFSYFVCLFTILYVCLLFSVFCVFVLFCALFPLLYIAASFLLLYKFTDHCHRVETQLQWINIISYRIISYHIISYPILLPYNKPLYKHEFNVRKLTFTRVEIQMLILSSWHRVVW
jgi:hypothetical protein